MNKKILIIILVILVAIFLALIPIISIARNVDIHPNNLFIAAKIMNGKCGNGICEIDEIILTRETECNGGDECIIHEWQNINEFLNAQSSAKFYCEKIKESDFMYDTSGICGSYNDIESQKQEGFEIIKTLNYKCIPSWKPEDFNPHTLYETKDDRIIEFGVLSTPICGTFTKQKILCEEDCKKSRPKTKPEKN